MCEHMCSWQLSIISLVALLKAPPRTRLHKQHEILLPCNQCGFALPQRKLMLKSPLLPSHRQASSVIVTLQKGASSQDHVLLLRRGCSTEEKPAVLCLSVASKCQCVRIYSKAGRRIDEGTETHLKMSTIWEHCWLNLCNTKLLTECPPCGLVICLYIVLYSYLLYLCGIYVTEKS